MENEQPQSINNSNPKKNKASTHNTGILQSSPRKTNSQRTTMEPMDVDSDCDNGSKMLISPPPEETLRGIRMSANKQIRQREQQQVNQLPYTPSLLANPPVVIPKRKRAMATPTKTRRATSSSLVPAAEVTPNPKPRKQSRTSDEYPFPEVEEEEAVTTPTRPSFPRGLPMVSPHATNPEADFVPPSLLSRASRRSVSVIPPYEPPQERFTPPREVILTSPIKAKTTNKSKPSSKTKATKAKSKGRGKKVVLEETVIIPVSDNPLHPLLPKREMPPVDLHAPIPPPSPGEDPILLSAKPRVIANNARANKRHKEIIKMSIPAIPAFRARESSESDSQFGSPTLPRSSVVRSSSVLPDDGAFDFTANNDAEEFTSEDSVILPAFDLDANALDNSAGWSDSDSDREEEKGEYTTSFRTITVPTKLDPPTSGTRDRMDRWGRVVSPHPRENSQIIEEGEEWDDVVAESPSKRTPLRRSLSSFFPSADEQQPQQQEDYDDDVPGDAFDTLLDAGLGRDDVLAAPTSAFNFDFDDASMDVEHADVSIIPLDSYEQEEEEEEEEYESEQEEDSMDQDEDVGSTVAHSPIIQVKVEDFSQEQLAVQDDEEEEEEESFVEREVSVEYHPDEQDHDEFSPEQEHSFAEQQESVVEQEVSFIEQDQSSIEQEQPSIEQEQFSVEQEQSSIEQEQFSIEQEQSFLEQEQSFVEQEEAEEEAMVDRELSRELEPDHEHEQVRAKSHTESDDSEDEEMYALPAPRVSRVSNIQPVHARSLVGESSTAVSDPVEDSDDEESDDENLAMEGVVRITSDDPRAAARAAAILKKYDYDCFTKLILQPRVSALTKNARRKSVSSSGIRKSMSPMSNRSRSGTPSVTRRRTMGAVVVGEQVFIPGMPVTTLPELLKEAEGELEESASGSQLGSPQKPSSAVSEWSKEDWKFLDACFTDERIAVGGSEESLADVDDIRVEDVVDRFIQFMGGDVERFGETWTRDNLIRRVKALQNKQRSGSVARPTRVIGTPAPSAPSTPISTPMMLNKRLPTMEVPDFTPLGRRAMPPRRKSMLGRPSIVNNAELPNSLMAPRYSHLLEEARAVSRDEVVQQEEEVIQEQTPIQQAAPVPRPAPVSRLPTKKVAPDPATITKRMKGFIFSYLPTLPSAKSVEPSAQKYGLPPPPPLTKPRGPINTPVRMPAPKPAHPKDIVHLNTSGIPVPKPKTRKVVPQRLVELVHVEPEPESEVVVPRPRRSSGASSVKDLVKNFEEAAKSSTIQQPMVKRVKSVGDWRARLAGPAAASGSGAAKPAWR